MIAARYYGRRNGCFTSIPVSPIAKYTDARTTFFSFYFIRKRFMNLSGNIYRPTYLVSGSTVNFTREEEEEEEEDRSQEDPTRTSIFQRRNSTRVSIDARARARARGVKAGGGAGNNNFRFSICSGERARVSLFGPSATDVCRRVAYK